MAKTNWNLDQLSIGQQEALLDLTNKISQLSLKPKTFTKIDSIKTFYKVYTLLFHQVEYNDLDLDYDNQILQFIMDNTIVEAFDEPIGDMFHDWYSGQKVDPMDRYNIDAVSIIKNLIKINYNI